MRGGGVANSGGAGPRRLPGWAAAAPVAWMVVGLLTAPLTGSGGLEAQEPTVITFGEAIELAMERNTDLLRARADIELRGAVQLRERMDFLPEVSLSTRGRRSFGRSFSQEDGAILSEVNDVLDGGVSASLNLFDGMEKFASLRQASLQEDASRLRLERTQEDVVFQVVEGYTTLVQDRELARVREEELEAATELLAQVRRLVDLGRQPLSDLYQQQAAQAEAEAALVEARRQVELSETALMQVLELDPLGDYVFQAPELPEVLPEPVEYALEPLLEKAYAQRPDLAALERGLAASDRGVTMARSGYWPSLSVSVDYGSNWSSNSLQPIPGTGEEPSTVTVTPDNGGPPIVIEVPGTGQSPDYRRPPFMDQLDARRGGSVSLSLNVPVFDRLQTRAAVRQAEVARLNARYDLQDQRQQVALQVRQALLDYRAAVARQAATARRVEAAERAWEAAERRYELGAATFVEVVQARSTLVSARSAAITARFNVLLARRVIAYHTGELDPRAALTVDFDQDPSDA